MTKLLALLVLLTSPSLAETWQYRVPMQVLEGGQRTMTVAIQGRKFRCIFDTGANAYDAIWIQRGAAASLGLNRKDGGGFNYYDGLSVSAGGFSRRGVLAYEYSTEWAPNTPCLVGDAFFKGEKEIMIDVDERSLYVR